MSRCCLAEKRYHARYIEKKGPFLQKKIKNEFLKGNILNGISMGEFRHLNEALMDVGRVLCQARKASCELCPLKTGCYAYQNKSPLKFPTQVSVKKIEHQLVLNRFLVFDSPGKKILAYQKKAVEWLEWQWELPTTIQHSTDKNLKQYPRKKSKANSLFELTSGITKYKILNRILNADKKQVFKMKFNNLKFIKTDLQSSNFTSTTFKILKKQAGPKSFF